MGEEPKKDENAPAEEPKKEEEKKKTKKTKKGEKEPKEEKPVYKDKEGNIVYAPDGRPMEIGPNGEAVAPPPLTEVQQIHLKIENTIDDSLESTRRMVQLMEESKDAGIKTLVMLDEQGEQLDRIEENADKINQEMKEAEKNLEGMEGCCGLCVLPWQKAKSVEDTEEYQKTWKAKEDGKLNSSGPRRVIGEMGPSGKGFVNRITNDAREDEMDDNLVQVGSMIGNLRNMAIDMGTEIENQNHLIGRVEKKTESNTQRVEGANKRTAKLLKA